jgi:hypothetical protein
MRLFVVLAVALALALPAIAPAERGSSDAARAQQSATQQTQATKKKQKKKQRKQRKKKRGNAAQRPQSSQGAASSATDDEIEVKGPLTSLSPPTVAGVSCVVPAGASVRGFVVGDIVEMTCDRLNGTWTLRKLEREDDEADEREVKGPIQSLSPFTVAGVTCVVPATISLAGLAAGDVVEMKCRLLAGTWTVTRLELEDDDSSGRGDDDEDEDDEYEDDDNSGRGGGGDD